MAKQLAYRYDEEVFVIGSTIRSRGDHLNGLTDDEKKIEGLIRSTLSDGERIRATSLYVWADKKVATRIWRTTKKPHHLYELEIETENIILEGDLNQFSAAVDTVDGSSSARDFAVRQYCRGVNYPRIELLVEEATVLRKLYDVSEK